MTKILIATPTHGEMFYTPYVQSIIRLQRLIDRNKWESMFSSICYADLVESRNYLLTHWFDKTDASHILFIDADMGFEPTLIADMIDFGKPVTGVIAPKRQIDLKRLAALSAKGEPAERAIARAHDFIFRPARRPGILRSTKGFVEVEGCGAGILLIERSCLKTMLAAIPDVSDDSAKKHSPLAKDFDRMIRAFDIVTTDGARLSEDFSFCHRWRSLCGGEVWANIKHAITHVGLHRYAGRYADAMPKGPRIVVGGQPRAVPAPPATASAQRVGDGGSGKTQQSSVVAARRGPSGKT